MKTTEVLHHSGSVSNQYGHGGGRFDTQVFSLGHKTRLRISRTKDCSQYRSFVIIGVTEPTTTVFGFAGLL